MKCGKRVQYWGHLSGLCAHPPHGPELEHIVEVVSVDTAAVDYTTPIGEDVSFRIIITGSKDWDDEETIMGAMEEYAGADGIVLVTGECPTGADVIAAKYAYQLGWEIEPHPAEWVIFGDIAGQMRNVEMVAQGADLCLAFIKDHSRDASHCAQYARMAHIHTIVYSQTGEFSDGKFIYCQDTLTFGETYLHCTKEASDNHLEHQGKGSDDEGKLYFISWKDRVRTNG